MSKNLLSLLLLVGTFAMYYLLISPLYTGAGGIWQPEQSIKSLKQLNGEYDQTINEANSLYTQAENLKKQYSTVSDDAKSKMAIMVPGTIDTVRLLSEVHDLIQSSGLVEKDLGVADGTTNLPHLGSKSVTFTVQTSYPKFKELMDNFEKSMRLYSIQNISFTASQKEGDLTSYQVQLETYFLK